MQIAGTGIRDWKLQHLAAVVITAYIFCVLGFLVFKYPDLLAWKLFMSSPAMKVFTLVTLLQVMIHRWIGMWAVLTDYVKNQFFRMFLEGAMMIALMACFFWGLIIVVGA